MIPVMMLASACQSGEKGEKVPGIDVSDMDLTVSPAQDFYKYADGGWIKKHPLKPEYARFGSFDALRENNVERLNALFAEMATMSPAKGTTDQKIVDLYKQGLDSTRRNAEGAAPLKKYLDAIYSAADKAALNAELAALNKCGEGGFFSVGVSADLMDSNKQVLYLGQGGLGMGDRDYYIEESNAALKKGYGEMLAKLFTLSGLDNAGKRADNALATEDKIAKVSWTSIENRDYTKQYNPMSVGQIDKAYPGFGFTEFFKALGIEDPGMIIVQQPSYFKGFAKIWSDSSLDALKDYLAGLFISSSASALSDDFYAASFDFFSTQMSGVTEQKPRWKRAMSVPNSILGEAVGQMYVKKYFPESYKNQVLDLVKQLQISLGQHIDSLEWMSDETKAYAREKLASFTVKIGYPDKWKDYSTLSVDPEASYLENLMAASSWYVQDNLGKLGKQTDRSEWGMTPQTVNAYYNPTTNEICFPAAILQPPFFDPNVDEAVNYGGIGGVIGHEMSHGFDDQGSQFDKYGNQNDWWTAADKKNFEARTKVLVDYFSSIEALPGKKINGKLTLGENIGDNGGLNISFRALQNSMKEHPLEVKDGFTPEQRFFLNWARVWASNASPQVLDYLVKSDPHSPNEARVNAALSHIDAWYKAFNVKKGDKLFLPKNKRAHIW